MYTIGQVSEMFHLPVSTLRYYDKEGLFPSMEIKDIKQFMDWCAAGPSTYPNRRELFENRKKALEEQLRELEKNMAMIQFKCWYYDQAIADGNEEHLKEMIPDNLSSEIKKLYKLAHS